MNIIKLAANEYKLFSNDQHIGSPEVDYKMIKDELKEAKTNAADILIGGDLFDAIIPKDGKRYTPGSLHRRLWGKNDVIGEQIDWACEVYDPVKDQIVVCGEGNHDRDIEKFHGFNPIKEFLKRIGRPKAYIGYDGYIKYPGTTIYFHHGTGSGTSISGAIGEFEKRMKFIEADIIWMGHKHHRLYGGLRKLLPSAKKSRRYQRVRFIMPGSYLDTYSSVQESYGEIKNYPPQEKGGVWMFGRKLCYE